MRQLCQALHLQLLVASCKTCTTPGLRLPFLLYDSAPFTSANSSALQQVSWCSSESNANSKRDADHGVCRYTQARLLVQDDSPHINTTMCDDLLKRAKMAWKQTLKRTRAAQRRRAADVSQTLTRLGYTNSTGNLTEDGLLSQDIHVHGKLTSLCLLFAAAILAIVFPLSHSAFHCWYVCTYT